MSITDGINGLISGGTNLLGAASALSPILPQPLQNALGTFINGQPRSNISNRSLNDFRSSLNKFNGLARSSLFHVTIPVPKMMAGSTQGDNIVNSAELSLLCEQATLPGVSLATTEIKRHGYGAVEKKPYTAVFTDQTFNFYGDNKGSVHKYFYSWMNGIVKTDLNPNERALLGYNGLSPFEVEFKENYAVDIIITCVDEVKQDIIICKLNQAYPIFLGDVSLSWADTDTIMRLPITFTFYNWNLERVNINSALTSPANNLSGLQKLLKVGTAVQTLASLRAPTGIADIINVVSNAKIAVGGLSDVF
jgi:hypothetical protein